MELKCTMDSNGQNAPSKGGEEAVVRVGAFAKRRNPLPDDPPENDDVTVGNSISQSLHVRQQQTIDLAESPLEHHQRLEWAATLRSYRNTKILLSNLVEIVPKGKLTLVSWSYI
jgi:hypothetical protein